MDKLANSENQDSQETPDPVLAQAVQAYMQMMSENRANYASAEKHNRVYSTSTRYCRIQLPSSLSGSISSDDQDPRYLWGDSSDDEDEADVSSLARGSLGASSLSELDSRLQPVDACTESIGQETAENGRIVRLRDLGAHHPSPGDVTNGTTGLDPTESTDNGLGGQSILQSSDSAVMTPFPTASGKICDANTDMWNPPHHWSQTPSTTAPPESLVTVPLI
ncbi:unnamed protein product [Echinostoma caproni]|uniref:Amyloid beta A4 precursor protein-binding family A member 2-like n=1 Tax=Echinostoma caproni TaxID=27848 RepID=A0A183AJ35_9TREM|nr:unnamed protein product [Echinostoma caproni]